MKVLHISLGKHQTSQADALKAIATEYRQIDWTENPVSLDAAIRAMLVHFQPDITFMQLQREGLVRPDTLQAITGKKYNWTGDVRSPIPQWYKNLSPYFDSTLFSNGNDVSEFRSQGLRSDFLNIGFEEPIYTKDGEKEDAGVVFMGNNYGTQFPLSKFRADMVKALPFIEVYGGNWANAKSDLNDNPKREAAIYRGCKIAINLSHFDYDRYSSDRMLRIMACGAFCLSHHYQGIEKDFEVGKDLDTWRTIDELNAKINHYLANPEQAKAMAQNGCEKVWQQHRWKNRIDDLLTLAQVG